MSLVGFKSAVNECARELLEQGECVQLIARGGSMRPFIQDGDRLRLSRMTDLPRVGDVIWLSVGDREQIHRLIAHDPVRGFRTRGDALPSDDGWFGTEAYVATLQTVERDSIIRPAPDSKAHLCLVAFLRGLRHIDWKLARVFQAKR